MNEIKLKAVQHYGKWTYYPLCKDAKLFAKIAGTQTLTMPVLIHIKSLGYALDITMDKPAVPAALEQ